MVKWTYENRDDIMKKKGFTIVELIAVITVLALLLILVVPTITSSSTSAREKTYQTKIESIETAAKLYGQDNYRTIVDGANDGEEGFYIESTEDIKYRVQKIKVSDLVPKYVEPDTDEGTGHVVDPRNSNMFLDDYEIEVKINTNTRKVTAKFIDPDEEN